MRIARPVVSVLAFLFVSVVSNAQQTSTTAPRDAQAVLMLQRSLAALTGMTAINDATLNGTVTRVAGSDSESGTATLKAMAVGLGRMDLSLPSGQRSEVRNISVNPPTGSWLGPNGTWTPIANHNLLTDPTWFFPQFLIQRVLSNTAYQISAMDAETQAGVAVEYISISQSSPALGSHAALLQSLSHIDIYLNATNVLPTAIAFNVHPDNNALANIPVKIEFSNYQSSGGVQVAYEIHDYLQGSLFLDISIQTVQFNTGLSTSAFEAQ